MYNNQVNARKRVSGGGSNNLEKVVTMLGHKIYIPHNIDLYVPQKRMMVHILRALKDSKNTMLESPTGSGKTLALLSATCAWLAAYRDERYKSQRICPRHGTIAARYIVAKQQQHQQGADQAETSQESAEPNIDQFMPAVDSPEMFDDAQYEPTEKEGKLANQATPAGGSTDKENQKCTCLPKICLYYCTRTHKQIAQVVKEYKRLPYAGQLKHTILASREQTCVNELARSSGGNLTENCKAICGPKKYGCEYRARLKEELNSTHKGGGVGKFRRALEKHNMAIWDIEDLKAALPKARLNVCPYFLTSREFTKDADLVFCPFNYLIDPGVRGSSTVALKNSIVIVDEAHNIEDVCRDCASMEFNEENLISTLLNLGNIRNMVQKHRSAKQLPGLEDKNADNTYQEYANHASLWLEYLKKFQQTFRTLAAKAYAAPADKFSKVRKYAMDAVELARFLNAICLKPDTEYYHNLSEALASLTDQGESRTDPKPSASNLQLILSSISTTLMEKLLLLWQFYSPENNKSFYNGVIEIDVKQAKHSSVHTQAAGAPSTPEKQEPTIYPGHIIKIKFNCMMPSLVWADAFHSCRTVILASGTLYPFDTFCSELATTFQSTMEGEQVIDKSQVFASAIGRGPTNTNLCLTYQNLQNGSSIISELATIVCEICELVPKGVLCFVSSYRFLDQLKGAIEGSQLKQRLRKVKEMFIEPRKSSDLPDTLREYQNAIKCPKRQCTGALMLAVFRGKVSEGIDFSDDQARCVISIGIPYPSFVDETVKQKRAFNDAKSRELGLRTGSDWYTTQAFRAINQALGRCLRHKNDWGALVLIDERFLAPPQQAKISRWVRDALQSYNDFSEFRERLQQFVKTNSERWEAFNAPKEEEDLACSGAVDDVVVQLD